MKAKSTNVKRILAAVLAFSVFVFLADLATGANVVKRFQGTVVSDFLQAIHIGGTGGTPSGVAAGTGCNTPSAPVESGTDESGTIGATCGGTGATAATVVAATFVKPYSAAPVCELTAYNAATAAIAVATQVFPAPSTTQILVKSNGTGLPAGTYLWSYKCSGN